MYYFFHAVNFFLSHWGVLCSSLSNKWKLKSTGKHEHLKDMHF